jgi:hypothetical protein
MFYLVECCVSSLGEKHPKNMWKMKFFLNAFIFRFIYCNFLHKIRCRSMILCKTFHKSMFSQTNLVINIFEVSSKSLGNFPLKGKLLHTSICWANRGVIKALIIL